MKILSRVVHRRSVNVMHYLSALCADNFTVFPFTAITFGAIAQPFRGVCLRVRLGCFLNTWRCGWNCLQRNSRRRNHLISAPQVFPRWKATDFLFVGEQRIVVSMPHLIMTDTHIPRSYGAVAIKASATNHPPGPSILRSAVLPHALVVHQTESTRSVFTTATLNRTLRHAYSFVNTLEHYTRYKALGNSMAVPCMSWIGERIQAVHELTLQLEAA